MFPIGRITWIAALTAFLGLRFSKFCARFAETVALATAGSHYGMPAGTRPSRTVSLWRRRSANRRICRKIPGRVEIWRWPRFSLLRDELVSSEIGGTRATGMAQKISRRHQGRIAGPDRWIGFCCSRQLKIVLSRAGIECHKEICAVYLVCARLKL